MLMLGYLFLLLGAIDIHTTANNLQENIAINGKAVQSSTLPYEANKAIDNADLYCTHTETEANPWWRLDLMDLQVIQEVIVTNRIDCCFEQINGAEIRIGNSLENNGNNNPICAVISSIPAGVSSTYTCNGMEGRYVNLFIPGDTKYLTLCEVQVYEEGMMKQTTFVKMKLNSNSSLSEPAVRVQLLSQLQSALTKRGISVMTLQLSHKQEVKRKEAVPSECVHTNTGNLKRNLNVL
ncbi:fucolectin-like [Sinocyclocheilus anshuiensis]|uniref:fucolectin-like n=1 Tax=Sinocyclocheilus anshuiensis TaxID=1608454 RepID=UPI0007B8DA32|nr:PREDICTED: fucolectin-like [Sinocyclocheilus anshuiensis]